jgi:outer membrane protein assembly factor BamB
MHLPFKLVGCLALLSCASRLWSAPIPTADSAAWTRFRGPNGSGISTLTNLPATWTDKDYRWQAALPGTGHASPVIWGNQAFVLCTDNANAKLSLLSLRTTDGSVLWKRDFDSTTFPKNRDNSYASATPTVDSDHVYLYWTTPEQVSVVALDHAGKDAWRRQLGPYKSQHGGGTSPMLFQDLVIVNNDQDGPSSLIALDAKTGATRWQVDRRVDRASYATPCLRQTADQKTELIFASSSHGLTGINPLDGKVNWDFTNAFPLRVVASPIVADGLVIDTCGEGGSGRRLVAVRPGSATRPAELAYEIKNSIPYVPSALAKDGLLFLWGDNGLVACHRTATGEKLSQHKISEGFYSSPVWAEGRLYNVAKSGVVYVLAAAEKLEPLATIPLGEPGFATPAFSADALYFRTDSRLFCLPIRHP